MAASWKEAKECAAREGLLQVYHDCDDNVYGACRPGERQGCFKGGVFYRTPVHMHAGTLGSGRTRKKRKNLPAGESQLVNISGPGFDYSLFTSCRNRWMIS